MIPLVLGAAAAGIAAAAPLLLAGSAATVGMKARRISDLVQRGLVRQPSPEEVAVLEAEGKTVQDSTILAFYTDELIIAVDADEVEDTILAELGAATGLPDSHCVAMLQNILPHIREIGLPVGIKYDSADPNKEVLLRAYDRGREAGHVLMAMHAEKSRQ